MNLRPATDNEREWAQEFVHRMMQREAWNVGGYEKVDWLRALTILSGQVFEGELELEPERSDT